VSAALLIGFDESHDESWTLRRESSKHACSDGAELRFGGHLNDLLSAAGMPIMTSITSKWSQCELDKHRLLVICDPKKQFGQPSAGEPALLPDGELAALSSFVAKGGSLFILSNSEASRPKNNLNELCRLFGFAFNEDTAASEVEADGAHLLSRNFDARPARHHSITKSLRSLTYRGGCSIARFSQNVEPLVFGANNEFLAVAVRHGLGRVVAIGGADLFSLPCIGDSDNAALFAEIMLWLAHRHSDQENVTTISKSWSNRAFPLYDGQFNVDLCTVPGPHCVDCSPYSASLRLIAEGLGNPYDDGDSYLLKAELAFHRMPQEMREAIVRFKRFGNDEGVLLLRGLPPDSVLPDTPSNSRRSLAKSTHLSEFWLSAIGMALGDPISYFQEKDGELYHDICPVERNAKELSSESSTAVMDFHTETAFHPAMPDFVLLYCLRPDHDGKAKTFVASTRHIIDRLSLRSRALLFRKVFTTGIDYSFLGKSAEAGNGPTVSVLYGDPDAPFIRFDLDLMKAPDDTYEALREIKAIAEETKNFAMLREGDLCIIDNRRAIHGRSEFQPRYDGHDRWLQRLYVVRDLAYCEQERNRQRQRLIETRFSPAVS
jgi:alpha-ketoglutarate-dependent taurine dioxygenase